MPKLNSQKQWQKENQAKVKEYRQRYESDKIKITISLPIALAKRIDALKGEESRTEWARQIILEKLNSTQP